MKQRMAQEVDRFAAWTPEALQQRLHWKQAQIRNDQAEVAAMLKAQRRQRKQNSQRGAGDDRQQDA